MKSLTIGLYIRIRSSRYEARGKFGEHERCVRVARGVTHLESGYVTMETILHFFYKITNERGTKTVFTYAHLKWFYGQSERAY